MAIFADVDKIKCIDMLGFDYKKDLISGEFAREIQNVVRRASTNRLSDRDRQIICEREKELEKDDVKWVW